MTIEEVFSKELSDLGVEVTNEHWAAIAAEWDAFREPSSIQTLILSKERFPTADTARKWVTDHDFKADKIDEKEDTWRFRQREPEEFLEGSFKTITITDGVQADIGRAKTGMSYDTAWKNDLVARARVILSKCGPSADDIDITGLNHYGELVDQVMSAVGAVINMGSHPDEEEEEEDDMIAKLTEAEPMEVPFACIYGPYYDGIPGGQMDILVCAPAKNTAFEMRIGRVLPSKFDGRINFVYGNYEQIRDVPHQVIAWSKISGHSEHGRAEFALSDVDIRGLAKMVNRPNNFPMFVGRKVTGEDIIFTSTDLLKDGANPGVYRAIRTPTGQIWIYDVIEFEGQRVPPNDVQLRADLVDQAPPANDSGNVHAVQYMPVATKMDLISPLMITSKDANARGAFIMTSTGILRFENNEGTFGRVTRSYADQGVWNTVIDTEAGLAVFSSDSSLSVDDLVAVFPDRLSRYSDPENGNWCQFGAGTYVFKMDEAMEHQFVPGDHGDAEEKYMPSTLVNAMTSYAMHQDSRYARPENHAGKFSLKINVIGADVDVLVHRELPDGSQHTVKLDHGIRLSREATSKSDAKGLFDSEIRDGLFNQIRSGRMDISKAPQVNGDAIASSMLFEIDAGKYQMGVVSPGLIEVFYEGDFLKGRFIERDRGGQWFMIRSEGTPLSLVKGQGVPPIGFSGLPAELEQAVPTDYQYWNSVSRDHRTRVRDSLIDAVEHGEFSFISDEKLKFTMSRQTYQKPAKTGLGHKTGYTHLRFCGGDHFFLFADPKMMEAGAALPDGFKMRALHVSGDTPKDFMTLSGDLEPNSRFNNTDKPSKLEMVSENASANVISWFNDWIVMEFHEGPMRGIWSFRKDESEGVKGHYWVTRHTAFRTFTAYMHNEAQFGEEMKIEEFEGEGTDLPYIIVTTPFFPHGRLTDGKRRTSTYRPEDVAQARLVNPKSGNMPYVDLYHQRQEFARVGVIMEIWWDANRKFEYTDVLGNLLSGTGMMMGRFMVKNADGIRQIMDANERSISVELRFDSLPNPDDPSAPYAVHIGVEGVAITPDPMVKVGQMEEACSGGKCFRLGSPAPADTGVTA